MKAVERAKYKDYLEKGDQHLRTAKAAFDDNAYDAAITNACIGLINYLDALSVNRFGKDLSSDNHEAAPILLQKMLSGAGEPGFKELSQECAGILKLKNTASYRSDALTKSDAKKARDVGRRLAEYVRSKVDDSL